MKKKMYFFVLVLMFVFSLTSCKPKDKLPDDNKTDQQGEKNHFDFKSEDEILSNFINKQIKLSYNNNNYEFIENELYLVYGYGNNTYLLVKETNLVYEIDDDFKTKTLKNMDLTIDKVYNFYKDVFLAYLKIQDSYFVKSDTKSNVAGVSCDKYVNGFEFDFENLKGYKEEIYTVDSNTGIGFSHSLTINTGKKETSSWEVTYFSDNKLFIDSTLNEISKYELTLETVTYKAWPTSDLGKVLPEFRNGTFLTACDNTLVCEIYFNTVSLINLQDYLDSLKTYGFTNFSDTTNEAGQYFYNTYNSDFFVAKFKLSDGTLKITIFKSSQENINDDMEAFL